ncbi:MAG: hypothetical protein IRY87_26050, partial [Acetobacteraceae bacterium]|nr:hypothetical protein [Acetobacteraceae bacterium]
MNRSAVIGFGLWLALFAAPAGAQHSSGTGAGAPPREDTAPALFEEPAAWLRRLQAEGWLLRGQ